MTENTLNYNYDVSFCERYYLTNQEAFALIEKEQNKALNASHALILTGKSYGSRSFFDAFSSKKLSHNFTWIHFCPQEILKFDDDKSQKGCYYVSVMKGIVREIKNLKKASQ